MYGPPSNLPPAQGNQEIWCTPGAGGRLLDGHGVAVPLQG